MRKVRKDTLNRNMTSIEQFKPVVVFPVPRYLTSARRRTFGRSFRVSTEHGHAFPTVPSNYVLITAVARSLVARIPERVFDRRTTNSAIGSFSGKPLKSVHERFGRRRPREKRTNELDEFRFSGTSTDETLQPFYFVETIIRGRVVFVRTIAGTCVDVRPNRGTRTRRCTHFAACDVSIILTLFSHNIKSFCAKHLKFRTLIDGGFLDVFRNNYNTMIEFIRRTYPNLSGYEDVL